MLTKDEISNLGDQISRHSIVATGYFQVSRAKSYCSDFMLDDLHPGRNNAYAENDLRSFNDYKFPKRSTQIYGNGSQIFDFAASRLPKSILLSSLVGDKFYEQTKNDMIVLAQSFAERDATTDWHMKVITHRQKPFSLLNVFITNTNNPQIVHLGYRIADLLLSLYPSQFKISTPLIVQLDKLTYIQTISDPKAMFRKHLKSLDDKDIEPMVDWLYNQYQAAITRKCLLDDQKRAIIDKTSMGMACSIDNLDIESIFDNCYNHLFRNTNDTEFTKQAIHNRLEIKLIATDLMNRLS